MSALLFLMLRRFEHKYLQITESSLRMSAQESFNPLAVKTVTYFRPLRDVRTTMNIDLKQT